MVVAAEAADGLGAHVLELPVAHRQHDAVVVPVPGRLDGLDAVFVVGFVRVDPGVVHVHPHVVFRQFLDHVHHPGVAQVRAVLLEGQAHHQHPGTVHLDAAGQQSLDQLAGHVAAHAVVDAPAGEDHLGVVADGLGLVGQVVGVHADAVAAHQAGPERQKVPFGAGGFQHFLGVDVQAVEDHRQLIDQGDVQVALGVFDHLGRFRHLDGGGLVGAGGDDGGVQVVDGVRHFRGGAGGHLLDGGDPVFLVARVDALRAVAGEEVLVEGEPGDPLQHRHAVFLGGAGVDGGLVDHDVAFFQGIADGLGGADQGRQVRPAVPVDGGGHGDDVDVAVLEVVGVGAEGQAAGFRQLLIGHFQGAVVAVLQGADTPGVDVEPHHRAVFTKFHGQRQADVAEADHGQFEVFHAGLP